MFQSHSSKYCALVATVSAWCTLARTLLTPVTWWGRRLLPIRVGPTVQDSSPSFYFSLFLMRCFTRGSIANNNFKNCFALQVSSWKQMSDLSTKPLSTCKKELSVPAYIENRSQCSSSHTLPPIFPLCHLFIWKERVQSWRQQAFWGRDCCWATV